jgi:hypothetical protein
MEIVLYRWFKKNAVRWLESKKMDSFFNRKKWEAQETAAESQPGALPEPEETMFSLLCLFSFVLE